MRPIKGDAKTAQILGGLLLNLDGRDVFDYN